MDQRDMGWSDYDTHGYGQPDKPTELRKGFEQRIINLSGAEATEILVDYINEKYKVNIKVEDLKLQLQEARSADAGGRGQKARIIGVIAEIMSV